MARQMLEHRQDAAGQQALRDRAGDGRDLARLGSIGAVADHRVGAGYRNIRQRKAIDVDAEDAKICRDQMAAEPGSRQASGRLPVEQARHRRRRAGIPANVAARGAAPGRLPGPPKRALPSQQYLGMIWLIQLLAAVSFTFLLKMIRPQGWASRRNARSLAEIVSPLNPVMNARAAIGAD